MSTLVKEITLSNYLLSLFNSANNNTLDQEDVKKQANQLDLMTNVIIRTSFKDYQVHDLIVKRSGLFKIMLESHETWNLEKQDGKPIINLITMEKSIFNDGSEITQEDFELVLRYLYSDEIAVEELDGDRVKKIVFMARFFDLDCLNEYLLRIYGNEENLQYSGIYFQIKHLLEREFTQEDFVTMVFNDYQDWETYTNELVDLICQQEIVPLEKKLKLLREQIKYHNQVTTITSDHLKPFEKSFAILHLQARSIFNNQIVHSHNYAEIAKLLGIDLSPINGTIENNAELLSSQSITNYLLVADEKNYGKIKLFDGNLMINIRCQENNSAYWWDLRAEHRANFNSVTIYYQYGNQPITKVRRYEFTIYSEQFKNSGERINILVMIKK